MKVINSFSLNMTKKFKIVQKKKIEKKVRRDMKVS